MTKEEFEAGYRERSGLSKDEYGRLFVTLPCDCGDIGCIGWAAVCNNPESVKTHNELYAPEQATPHD